ncbi:MAG: PD-(D/E)XK nuclease family protein, partial [Deltaproteobacteria bacterium]|nr:PD-(D/E)XK nuclease family protein [Deltaproteobacteria bacterium]
ARDRGERARRDAVLLTKAGADARERMARPLRGAASQEAHERLEALLDSAGSARSGGRDLAMRVGSEIHRVVEDLDLMADPAAALDDQRARLRRRLADAPDVAAAAEEVLDVLAAGELLPRLRALRGSIVARELAFLAPPRPGAGGASAGPVGCVEGVLDLVYRDAGTGEWVVADYKTDVLVEERVDAYLPQLAVYARALRDGLGLDALPRCELWFLRADRVVTLDGDAVHSAAP